MTKICGKCHNLKPIDDFYQYKNGINRGYFESYCKKCCSEVHKTPKARITQKNYREKLYKLKKEKYPWWLVYDFIQQRCSYKGSPYYKKGIKNFLRKKDVETLWLRDKAHLMKKPTIDRINPDGNYTFDNCRFVEFLENVKRVRRELVSGENNGQSKLNWKSVAEIKQKYREGKTYMELAKEYRVDFSNIGRIIRNEQWKTQ